MLRQVSGRRPTSTRISIDDVASMPWRGIRRCVPVPHKSTSRRLAACLVTAYALSVTPTTISCRTISVRRGRIRVKCVNLYRALFRATCSTANANSITRVAPMKRVLRYCLQLVSVHVPTLRKSMRLVDIPTPPIVTLVAGLLQIVAASRVFVPVHSAPTLLNQNPVSIRVTHATVPIPKARRVTDASRSLRPGYAPWVLNAWSIVVPKHSGVM